MPWWSGVLLRPIAQDTGAYGEIACFHALVVGRSAATGQTYGGSPPRRRGFHALVVGRSAATFCTLTGIQTRESRFHALVVGRSAATVIDIDDPMPFEAKVSMPWWSGVLLRPSIHEERAHCARFPCPGGRAFCCDEAKKGGWRGWHPFPCPGGRAFCCDTR